MRRHLMITLAAVMGVVLSQSLFAAQAPAATANATSQQKSITVGILVPIEIQAMDEIVAGFQNELNKKYPGKIRYLVKNAQGDPNFQRSILQEFATQNVDFIVPIGTNATQMAMTMIRNKPIIGVASEITQSQISNSGNSNVTEVVDVVDANKQFQFFKQILPQLKMLTLIHSASDNIYNLVQQVKQVAPHYGIQIQDLLITQLPDLYSMSQQINPNSGGIFILRDLLVASGINTMVQQAQKRQIPMIASDDGSVKKGAAFALGISENQIGVDGADLTLKVINGTSAGSIPIYAMTKYTVYLNADAAKIQGIDPQRIEAIAKQVGYPVIHLNTTQK